MNIMNENLSLRYTGFLSLFSRNRDWSFTFIYEFGLLCALVFNPSEKG